jgi:hypothetical protein
MHYEPKTYALGLDDCEPTLYLSVTPLGLVVEGNLCIESEAQCTALAELLHIATKEAITEGTKLAESGTH